jgi:crotonobetainyl-CoA:carnitine CoA-transferase CaiB-like acyl-CoA transferase
MGPLADLRVIELCDELGQLAGKLLADMGADVIKVEPPAGSSARSVGPFVGDLPGVNRSLSFWYYNTNKRSVVLDLEGNAADCERLRQLVRGADIVIESYRPGYLSSLGLGYDELSRGRPGLIMCSITPFGQDGPWAQWQATDLTALALGGQMMMNGYDPDDVPDAPPIRGNGDQSSNTACFIATHGILAALLHRDSSGEGQYIDCSMHEALASTTEIAVPTYLYRGQDVVRQTGRHASLLRTERWMHRARDGRDVLIFGVGRDNDSWTEIKRWFQAQGFGLQFDEPRFDDPRARQSGRGAPEAAEIMQAVDQFIAANDAEDVYRGGQQRDQAWGVVRAPDEALQDQHWWDRGFFASVSGEGVEQPVAMPGAPYLLSATPWELRRPAPRLGEHTEEVLAELAAGIRTGAN